MSDNMTSDDPKIKKIVVAGGSGLVGQALVRRLLTDGWQVTVIDLRQPAGPRPENNSDLAFIRSDLSLSVPAGALDGARAVVNLSGRNINVRWSKKEKRVIRDSRVESNRNLVKAIESSKQSPEVFVSASAAGYYGDLKGQEADENTRPGSDFLAQVCVEWESAAQAAAESGARVVQVRTTPVIGPGGLVAQVARLFNWGLGAQISNGQWWMSWISLADLVEVYMEAIDNAELQGPINAASPQPVQNAEFMQILAQALKRPAWVRLPFGLLSLLLGQEKARSVTVSQKVKSVKLTKVGFEFQDPDLKPVLRQALLELGYRV